MPIRGESVESSCSIFDCERQGYAWGLVKTCLISAMVSIALAAFLITAPHHTVFLSVSSQAPAATRLGVYPSTASRRPRALPASPPSSTQTAVPQLAVDREHRSSPPVSASLQILKAPQAWALLSCGLAVLCWLVNRKRSITRPGCRKMVSDLNPLLMTQATFAVTGHKVVGIDLGTTNSAIAVMEGGNPQVIANSEGAPTTPSVVAYTKGGDLLVGGIARRQAVSNPDNTFGSVKRLMGRQVSELAEEDTRLPYRLMEGADGNVKIWCPALGKELTPEEVSAQVLRKLVRDAQEYLGHEVTKAIITVPAYFNDAQRQATWDAGRVAGLDVLSIINEPTAASLSYGLDKELEATILVFDLGGGTLDVSVLEVGDGLFEVLSTNGDTHLGGDDFDNVIVQWLAKEFKREEGVDLLLDREALQRLTQVAERAKQDLSTQQSTRISLPFIASGVTGPKSIDRELTRDKFNALTSGLLDRCRAPVLQALKDAQLTKDDVDEVLLVGGATRMPAVKELVQALVEQVPTASVNVDEAVALGAAVQGGVLSGSVDDVVLLDVTPLSLGVEVSGGFMSTIIPRNTSLPTSAFEIFSTTTDGQTTVDSKVVQGEREFADDNKLLGTFRLDTIRPAPRGVPQIEVHFQIDTNGILHVTATDKESKERKDIKITDAGTLSDDDVGRMIREAEANAEADALKRNRVEIEQEAKNMVSMTEDQLERFEEFETNVPNDVLDNVTGALVPLKEAIDANSLEGMKVAMENLQFAFAAMQRAVYGQKDLR